MITLTKQQKIDDINLMLSVLAVCTYLQNSGGFFNLNHHAEYLFRDLLNALKGWNLSNENDIALNAKGFDLIDENNKILVQVTSERSATKVRNSLSKLVRSEVYTFYLMCYNIVPPPPWQSAQFSPPQNIIFNAEKNVISIRDIANECSSLSDGKLNTIWRTLSSYVRGEEPQAAMDINSVCEWIQKIAGAYNWLCKAYNLFDASRLDRMLDSSNSSNWHMFDLCEDFLSLEGAHLKDSVLLNNIHEFYRISDKIALLSKIETSQDIKLFRGFAQRGMDTLKKIIICLGEKAGVPDDTVLGFFNRYRNS